MRSFWSIPKESYFLNLRYVTSNFVHILIQLQPDVVDLHERRGLFSMINSLYLL